MFTEARPAKALLRHLPAGVKHALRCQKYQWQIKNGTFASDEQEFALVADLVGNGDWVLDVGANVGHYTRRFSELVGAEGRVIAIEPNPETFSILAQNCRHFPFQNVTLLNLAASQEWQAVRMDAPSERLDGHYLAHISSQGSIPVLAAGLGFLQLPKPIRLIKMDVERHELEALAGLEPVIRRDKPALIIEAGVDGIDDYVGRLGYQARHLPGSHNLVFLPGS